MQVSEINSLDTLKQFLLEYRENKGLKSLHRAIQNSKKLKEFLDKFCYEDDLNYAAKAEVIMNELKRSMCVVCGNKTQFNLNKRDFLECCSVKCAANNSRRNNQIKETNLKKYDSKNFWGSKSHQENLKKLNLEKHGSEYYFNSDEFKEKSKKTSLEKYGTDRPQKSIEVKKKLSETRNKLNKKLISEKAKNTWLEKYGVDHPFKNLEIFEKQQKSSYYFKDYILPSGKLVRVQGYENRALDALLEKYNEVDLVISNSEIFKILGVIEYVENGSTHRYFPDIYIPKDNLIIEVKSTRTFSVHKKKNLLKREAIEKMGIKFQFWIYGKDLKII